MYPDLAKHFEETLRMGTTSYQVTVWHTKMSTIFFPKYSRQISLKGVKNVKPVQGI